MTVTRCLPVFVKWSNLPLVARNVAAPGERLDAVRKLAASLHCALLFAEDQVCICVNGGLNLTHTHTQATSSALLALHPPSSRIPGRKSGRVPSSGPHSKRPDKSLLLHSSWVRKGFASMSNGHTDPMRDDERSRTLPEASVKSFSGVSSPATNDRRAHRSTHRC